MAKKKIDGPEVFYFPPFHPNCRCTVVALDDKGQPIDAAALNHGTAQLLESYEERHRPTSQEFISKIVDKAVIDNYPLFVGAVEEAYINSMQTNDLTIMKLKSIKIATDDELKKYGAENSFAFLVNSEKMYINARKCVDEYELDTAVLQNVKKGIFAEYGFASAQSYIFNHEYGHLIFDNYEAPLSKPLLQVFATRLWQDQCAGKFPSMSATAAISKSEMMAESFAQMYTVGDTDKMDYSALKLNRFMKEMNRLKKREKELLRTKDVDSLMQSCFEIIDKVMQD